MKYVVSLGSNLGERSQILESALEEIGNVSEIIKVSSFYETAPVGGPDQPDYMNAIVIIDSQLSPEDLLLSLQSIENKAGRTREVRWGARTLDLDLISAGDLKVESEFLTLPHPRAHERGFVLQPWLEIDADAEIVGKGRISELLAAIVG
ncbi:MAG: 2-amino-4-hydroxy-6-hydroxymethyldihydropteridine diphosphokinase [Actinomycetes bacterium]